MVNLETCETCGEEQQLDYFVCEDCRSTHTKTLDEEIAKLQGQIDKIGLILELPTSSWNKVDEMREFIRGW